MPRTLVDWLRDQPDQVLAQLDVPRAEIDERAFYPRLVLGEYLAAKFARLIEIGRASGIEMNIRTRANVTDVRVEGSSVEVDVTTPGQPSAKQRFDYLVLATGHQGPPDPETRPGYFTSPWPASALSRIRNCAVGIRGTSLSAIDAAVVLANHHGEFAAGEGDALRYVPNADTHQFRSRCFRERVLGGG